MGKFGSGPGLAPFSLWKIIALGVSWKAFGMRVFLLQVPVYQKARREATGNAQRAFGASEK